MTFTEQIELASNLAIYGDQHLMELQSRHGRNHYKTDFIGQPLTVLAEHLLNLAASRDTYENEKWWDTMLKNGFNDIERAYFHESQQRHIKFFFFIKLFSVIEAQFRILCRKIDPSALNSGRSDFKSIYGFVFPRMGLGDTYNALYDFCRLNRNTIHNLGLHTSQTQTVNYRNINYTFIEWQEVLMISPQLQFVIHSDLLESLIAIKNSKAFADLSNV